MTGRVAGKVALITGAASGIGRATAELLAHNGAAVLVCDLACKQSDGESVAAGIRTNDGSASFVAHDVTLEDSWENAVSEARRLHGRLDILVNNAGVSLREVITDTSLEDWRRQTEVNYDGVFLGAKHAIPLMREGKRGGSITNISSTAGFLPVVWLPGYSATKAAVISLTKTIAQQCGEARDGIRCNAILPGIIDTPMHLPERRGDAMGERSRDIVPLGIKGEPSDIAHGVLYLASDEARYVTGAALTIDGGLSTRFPMTPHSNVTPTQA